MLFLDGISIYCEYKRRDIQRYRGRSPLSSDLLAPTATAGGVNIRHASGMR